MTPPALLAYREAHRIEAVFVRDPDGFKPFDKWVCAHDGIRVHREADGGYRHSADEIEALARIERGGGAVLAW